MEVRSHPGQYAVVMGLFSRRAEHLDSTLPDSQSAVSFRAIRARFYGNGKGKGKERELDGDSLTYASISPSLSSPHVLSDNKSFVSARVSEPRGFHKASRRVASSASISLSRPVETVSEHPGPRSSTDAVTITLAQRLNELATANSEGLLSDDEYRLLRQNLFERFASNTQIPAEAPIVPISTNGHGASGSRISISSTNDRRTSSQFYVQSSRASVQSKSSLTSSIGGFLRRATSKSRRVVSSPSDLNGDAASIYSTGSNTDRARTTPRTLASRASESSFQSGLNRTRTTQLRPIITQSDPGSPSLRPSRGRKRSGSSAPPSAFHGAPSIFEPTSPLPGEPLPNDDEVVSAKDIRHHIELVEAEGRRLLDAFNGLELSTLTRRHKRPHHRPPIPLSPSVDNASVHTGDVRSLHTTRDADTLSFKSGGSGARTPSTRRRSPGPAGPRKMHASHSSSSGALFSPPSKAVSRKGSVSSMSSHGRAGLSIYPGLSAHYSMASSSSVNLARSANHLPLATVAEAEGSAGGHRKSTTEDPRWLGTDVPPLPGRSPVKSQVHAEDEDIKAMEAELADIRRRRAEVTARYEARLEYLRARLKGAELREKVMRK